MMREIVRKGLGPWYAREVRVPVDKSLTVGYLDQQSVDAALVR